MRDRRFVAETRGGSLKKQQHYLLMEWACACAEHVLSLFGKIIDERLISAINVGKDWIQGKTSVGEARKASVISHIVARKVGNPSSVAVARSVGHAVATAHMADHSLGAALYALKAIKSEGKSVDEERDWQNQQLPDEIRDLVLSARLLKEKSMHL
jgi:hypothetical protein